MKKDCAKCNNTMPVGWNGLDIHYILCWECAIEWERNLAHFNRNFIRPERSKREDSHTRECIPVLLHDCPSGSCIKNGKCSVKKVYEMRCSEHCSNTVRDK